MKIVQKWLRCGVVKRHRIKFINILFHWKHARLPKVWVTSVGQINPVHVPIVSYCNNNSATRRRILIFIIIYSSYPTGALVQICIVMTAYILF